ncbi:cell division protein FtsQ/DivIB [Rubrobacter indicoceani]|uniref:cell division protein FtsQ/DivIB n=1 Tax=Rubrobacter indicoceani TaxID=2051957 RepID=UPI000E5B5C55|nr:FtsQ-type POTRA domain-containing protein [Rubrobacter indicoceani]
MRSRRNRLTSHVLKTALLSVFAGAVAATAIFAGAYVAFPLKGVAVKGNEMLSADKVERLVSSPSLLTLNVASLQQEIESDPWVESAGISRDWNKNEVVVEVKERSAVLRVSVDGRIKILASDGTELPGDGGAELPVVELKGWRVSEVLGAARMMEGGSGFESVDSVGAEGISATVTGRRVLLSESVEAEQVEALGAVIRDNPEPAAVFDLRSPGRVVVGGFGGNGAAETSGENSGNSGSENPAG